APAQLDQPEQAGHVGAIAVCVGVRRGAVAATDRAGARATERSALVHAVDHGGEHVELLRIAVLGAVVLAGVLAEDLDRHLVGLAHELLELLRDLEVDHQTSRPPSISPAARRSRYQRSTGCSLT